jgi:hypothetical protein
VERRFPEIVLAGPSTNLALNRLDFDHVGVSGLTAAPTTPCNPSPCQTAIAQLPPPSFRKATDKAAVVYHWDGDAKNPAEIFVSLPSDASPAQKAAAGNAAPTLQVITDLGASPWGSNTVATLTQTDQDKTYLLNCAPLDSRLRCEFPGNIDNGSWVLQVHDPDHSGAAIATTRPLTKDTDSRFVLWSFSAPQWYGSKPNGSPDTLVFCAAVINDQSKPGQPLHAYLGSSSGSRIFDFSELAGPNPTYAPGKPSFCPPYVGRQPSWKGELQVSIANFNQITDQMTFVDANDPNHPVVLVGVHAISSPYITNISPDSLHFVGQNLVFSKISVAGANFPLDCTSGTVCSVHFDNPDAVDCASQKTCTNNLGKKSDYISFVDPLSFLLPMQKFDGTTMTPVLFAPSSQKAGGAGGDGSSGATSNQFSMSLSVSGSGNAAAPAAPSGNSQAASSASPAQNAPATAGGTAPAASTAGTPAPAAGSTPPVVTTPKPQLLVIQ